MSGNRDSRDDGNAIAGLLVAIVMVIVAIAAAYIGMNLGDWL